MSCLQLVSSFKLGRKWWVKTVWRVLGVFVPCLGDAERQLWLMAAMWDCKMLLDTLVFQQRLKTWMFMWNLLTFKYFQLRSKMLFGPIPCGLGLICRPPVDKFFISTLYLDYFIKSRCLQSSWGQEWLLLYYFVFCVHFTVEYRHSDTQWCLE